MSQTIACRFCGTVVAISANRRRASRGELEAERAHLLARDAEWDGRIKQSGARGAEDFLVPPIGCCGIYFALFVAGSLLLSAMGLKASKEYGTAVALIAVVSALVGVVLIIWRRETRRRERVVALERDRMADRELRRDRLREIEAELDALGD